jgi:hypothetical protein
MRLTICLVCLVCSVCLVYLVYLVCLIDFVYFVCLVSLVYLVNFGYLPERERKTEKLSQLSNFHLRSGMPWRESKYGS